jgi:hypothetical protein
MKPKYLEKTYPIDALSTSYLTWPYQGSNPAATVGSRREAWATVRPIYSTFYTYVVQMTKLELHVCVCVFVCMQYVTF